MTDKQIIIDGIDVSGCCQYMPRYMEDYDIDTLDYCRHHFKPCKDVDVKYCYYKQLKRKEQECEELKGKLKYIRDENVHLKESATDEQMDFLALNNYIRTLEFQIDQLKAENEELKHKVELMMDCASCKVDEYKQTLAEIKEIAETAVKCLYATKSDDYTDGYRWLGNIILQKISECEAE